jgi:glycosyltransferase involved in cell wall biosynthesis
LDRAKQAVQMAMNILLLNQTFHPDVVATAQYLTSLALELKQHGHSVRVICGRRGYDAPDRVFPLSEEWNGISIRRVPSTRFGKKSKWRRAVDFASFAMSCCFRLLCEKKPDVVLALSSPPLISFLAAIFARARGCRFCYWVMDLNPDEAIAAQWLRAGSIAGRTLEWMSRYSFRSAERIIALDRFMSHLIQTKGIPSKKITVIPPWAYEDWVRFDPEGRGRFRREHRLDGKFVVMYSGNHSPCHPLDTLLQAALRLRENPEIMFCFVGGGSEYPKVEKFAQTHQLENILCLPYQPLNALSASLSAADLQVVVMGNAFIGIVHPSKIYNILAVGTPVLYIGPQPSHVSDLKQEYPNRGNIHCALHGDIAKVQSLIEGLQAKPDKLPDLRNTALAVQFEKKVLTPRFIKALESLPATNGGMKRS